MEKTKQILDESGVKVKCAEIEEDPIKQHRVQSIVAGSIWADDRLYEAGLIEEKSAPDVEVRAQAFGMWLGNAPIGTMSELLTPRP